ncbi:ketopantoate reductase family protein [Methylobacterium nodulans]|uniref:2-dehydropantoate 2-reductase n=1 Tax=Methylobacterium nodulans (strain LMG 21967 / CNCM I-2342 / ORS 2060) TaxID=460265 RepID=B8INB6_METNO|nr:2-dehydropantoate 2-reductase [Methylobacterium nodulans]ACL56442.1 2-dehydropantoate 2-reductase [Methylobacterium nodulans ORS 2060]
MSKVAIVGCGAMGSVYAALMASAGHEVHAVTLWSDHAEVMRTKGLRVEGASGDRTVQLASAGTTTDGIGVCDLVIIATKAFDVEAAARACEPLIGPETVVQTIQNGLGSPEVAASVLDRDKIAVGVVGGFGASMRGAGHAHHNGLEMIRFGAFAGLPKQRLQASARIWESSGFKVSLFDDVGRMVWEKLIMNVTFSGTAATTGLTIGEIMADPHAWKVALGCAREAIAVAEAMGIALDVGDPIEHIRKLGGKIPNARPSMLLDYNAGRRGEVDAINGSIPRLGQQYGIPTPINETVVAIIKAREASFQARAYSTSRQELTRPAQSPTTL